jgi:hypothetical protein
MVIPTGVGASQGGYGGDATLWMNLIASVSDILITHPNVANAAMLQDMPTNVLYTEGAILDALMQGKALLKPLPARGHRLGILMDAGISEAMKIHHHNVILAHRSVYGLQVAGIQETSEPLHLTLACGASGISTGGLENPTVLIEAGKALIAQGATALVVCSYLEGPAHLADMEASYREGVGVDPIGGLEAIISHTLVKHLGVPVANVPVFSEETAAPIMDKHLTPQVAPEFITPSFAGCVLRGIRQAPPFVSLEKEKGSSQELFTQEGLTVSDVTALLVPYNALGSPAVLGALEHHIPIITIGSNQTILNVTAERLGLALNTVTPVANYLEAAGLLQLWRQHKGLPSSFDTPNHSQ